MSHPSDRTPGQSPAGAAEREEQRLPARFGRYVLVSHLGRGGMADVYRAQARGAGGFVKPVVIKRVQPEVLRKQSSVRMFIEEARLSAVLQHMNLVQIFDCGEEQGEYFLAMELVHGRDLHELMRRTAARGQEVPLPLACYIAMEVLKGLDYAHRACSAQGEPLNLVHRDVNPTNVLLSFEGEVKLSDFGVAWVGSTASTSEVRGKPGYIPPEQLTRKQADARGDLFALGITLYELLAGRVAFRGPPLEILKQTVALKHQPLRLGEVAPWVPAGLCAVVDRCMRANPDERYASAAEVLDALGDFLLSASLRVSQRQLAEWMATLYTPAERARPVDPPLPPELEAPSFRLPEPAPAAPTYSVREPGGSTLSRLSEEELHMLLASGRLSPQVEVSRAGGPFLPPTAFPALETALASAEKYQRARQQQLLLPRHAGDVAKVSPVRALGRLMVARVTGRLRFENGSARKELFLKAGRLVAVRSNLEEDRIGAYLLTSGKLTAEQWERAAGNLQPFSGRLLEALLASHVLTPAELAECVHAHRRAVALGVLRWTEGRYAFYENEQPTRDGTNASLGGLALLNEGVRTHYPLERLTRAQEPIRNKPLQRNPHTPVTPEELALSASELRALSLLKPGITLDGALASLRRPEDELPLRRMALLFTEVGLMDAA